MNSDKNYYTGEHILTCISPSPSCMKVIRSASRMASAFHAEFTAIYVETPYLQNADRKIKKMAEDNIHLAKALGAKIVTVFGEEVALQIAEYARVCRASKIVLGRTNHRILFGQKKGTLTDTGVRAASGCGYLHYTGYGCWKNSGAPLSENE